MLKPRPGPSVRVTTSGGITQVLSSPHPVHRATVERSRVLGRWIVVTHTASVRESAHRTMTEALHHAGLLIATMYRLDMRARFTGPQRYAMGQGQCPAHVKCADTAECTIRASHVHLCRSGPDMGSVWCTAHRRTGERHWKV